MNTLFLFYNADATIRTAAIRVNGKKVPDATVTEVYEFYQVLIELGHRPIVMKDMDGNPIHMIQY